MLRSWFSVSITHFSDISLQQMQFFNPIKAEPFEGSLFWRLGVGQFDPCHILFQEELIYQHNFTQLLNNLFRVGRK